MFDIVVAALLIGEPAAVDTSAIQYEELQCIQAPHGYQRQIAYRNNAQPDRFVWVDVARRNVSYLFDLSSQCDAGRPGRIAIPEAGILNLCVGRNIFASSSEIASLRKARNLSQSGHLLCSVIQSLLASTPSNCATSLRCNFHVL